MGIERVVAGCIKYMWLFYPSLSLLLLSMTMNVALNNLWLYLDAYTQSICSRLGLMVHQRIHSMHNHELTIEVPPLPNYVRVLIVVHKAIIDQLI